MPKKPKHPTTLRIAFSVDYRGRDDTVLTFVFIGATGEALHAAFRPLCQGGYIMRGFRLESEHCTFARNGKHFFRWAVTPIDYHPDFLSIDGLTSLIEHRLADQGHYVRFFKDYNKFLNV